MTITLPRKAPPKYFCRKQVRALFEANNLTEYSLRVIFPKGHPARIRLQHRKTDVYLRSAVLAALGIDDTPP